MTPIEINQSPAADSFLAKCTRALGRAFERLPASKAPLSLLIVAAGVLFFSSTTKESPTPPRPLTSVKDQKDELAIYDDFGVRRKQLQDERLRLSQLAEDVIAGKNDEPIREIIGELDKVTEAFTKLDKDFRTLFIDKKDPIDTSSVTLSEGEESPDSLCYSPITPPSSLCENPRRTALMEEQMKLINLSRASTAKGSKFPDSYKLDLCRRLEKVNKDLEMYL
jgi:hypothetical protein